MFLCGTCDALLVLHIGTEEPKEDEEQGQTGEDNAHGKGCNAEAMRVSRLENLWLAESCVLWKIARSDILGSANLPAAEVFAEGI